MARNRLYANRANKRRKEHKNNHRRRKVIAKQKFPDDLSDLRDI